MSISPLSFISRCDLGMFALNFISIELENPFGLDANDLPLTHFQKEMNDCLLMLLHLNTDLVSGLASRIKRLAFCL